MTFHRAIVPRRNRSWPACLAAALLVAAGGCKDSPAAPEDLRIPTSLVVESPATTFESLDETIALGVTVLDQYGEPMADPPLAWSVGSPGVVEIVGPGLLRSVGNGEVEVTIRVEETHPSADAGANGSGTPQVAHRVVVDQRPVALALLEGAMDPEGGLQVEWLDEPLDLTAGLVDANDHPVLEGGPEIEWDLGDSGILSWTDGGRIIATASGTATVRIRSGQWSIVIPVRVQAGADLEWCLEHRVPRPDAPAEGLAICQRTELTFGR